MLNNVFEIVGLSIFVASNVFLYDNGKEIDRIFSLTALDEFESNLNWDLFHLSLRI